MPSPPTPHDPGSALKPKPTLDLVSVDLDPSQTSDDTDAAWGESSTTADDVQRYLDEKPPHHVD